jgi:hypothetical protein
MDILAAERIFAIRLNTGVITKPNGNRVFCHSGGPGVADVLASPRVHLGAEVPAFLWIECKSDSGKQSTLQTRFQEWVESFGHHYLIARGSDDVLRWLKEHGCR